MYRKNTASQYVYFCLVNATTGAALTGATVTAYRALDNGAQVTATGTTTELANGQYRFNLSQADTNADYGSYLFTATNAVPVEKTVVFTQANPQDAAGFGLSRLDAAVSSRMATYTQPTGFLAADFTRLDAAVSSRMASYSQPTGFLAADFTRLDANVSSRMATYTQPTGFLAATFPTTVASTTNITGGTITSVTNRVTANTDQWNGTAVTSATVRSDLINIAGAAVSTSTAQLGVNVVNAGGTAWASGAITAASIAADAIGASELAADAVSEIATAVRDINNTAPAASSLGAAVNSAASAGDPWATSLPGAYGAGTAGNIVGNRLDAAVSSRMATYTQPTGFLAATFPTTVASTTNITSASGVTLAPTTGLGNQTANITGNLSGSVGSVTGAVNVDRWSGQSVALDSDNLPIVSVENYYDTSLASWLPISGRFSTILSAIDAVDNFVDTEVAAIKSVIDKVDTMLVLDGAVWQLTVNALENAPAGGGGGGGGGGTDWTANERTAIRSILGFDSVGTVSLPTVGVMDAIKDKTDLITAQNIGIKNISVQDNSITID